MPEEKKTSAWIEEYHSLLFQIMGIYEEWSQSYGINLHEYMILSYIYEHQERCLHKNIVAELFLPTRLVDSILKQFEQSEMIEYWVNSEDRREKIVRLTEIGLESAQKVILGGHEMERKAREKFGVERFDSLAVDAGDFLKSLQSALNELKV